MKVLRAIQFGCSNKTQSRRLFFFPKETYRVRNSRFLFNYIDVFSRMQIEKLILRYQPTMLLVEHDVRFQERIATNVIRMT